MKHLHVSATSSFFLVLLLNIATIFSQENPDRLPLKGICAHRGASETHPENTAAAFREAIRLGAQMIEFDVQMTKDGKLVVMHDASVDRTTNGNGLVRKLTLREIKVLDAGQWKSPEFRGERVPTLREALQLMPKNIWLNIHLKGNRKLGRETAKTIVSEKRTHQSVIACGYRAAKGVRQISADLNICNMQRLSHRSKYIAKTLQKKYKFIQLKKSRDKDRSTANIQQLKQHDIHINYFHSESWEEMEQLFQNGVDFILTDRLEYMLEGFKAKHSVAKQSSNH